MANVCEVVVLLLYLKNKTDQSISAARPPVAPEVPLTLDMSAVYWGQYLDIFKLL